MLRRFSDWIRRDSFGADLVLVCDNNRGLTQASLPTLLLPKAPAAGGDSDVTCTHVTIMMRGSEVGFPRNMFAACPTRHPLTHLFVQHPAHANKLMETSVSIGCFSLHVVESEHVAFAAS